MLEASKIVQGSKSQRPGLPWQVRDAQLTLDFVSYTAVNALHSLLVLHRIWYVIASEICHLQSQVF